MGVKVHLVDGTFELFRCFHGAPRATAPDGAEVGAARGLVATLTALLSAPDVTHVAVAFDSVVAPPGKTIANAGNEALIARQAPLAAECVRALGVPVWPSGRYQADELISTAAARFACDPIVDQVVICGIDNDFMQCVRGTRVVMLDRIRKRVIDEDAVRTRFGVAPDHIPDLFALIGDRSDGIPSVPAWGPQSAAAVINRYGRIQAIPLDAEEWDITVRGKHRLVDMLRARIAEALLCRDLSVLRTDLPLRVALDDLEWHGADRDSLTRFCTLVGDDSVLERITSWRSNG